MNPADWHFVRGMPYLIRITSGLRKPKITQLGIDVAGAVENYLPGIAQTTPH